MLHIKEDLVYKILNKRSTGTRGQKAKPEVEFTVKLNPSLTMGWKIWNSQWQGRNLVFAAYFSSKFCMVFRILIKKWILSEYLKSSIIQIIRKNKSFSAVDLGSIYSSEWKLTSIKSLKQKNLGLASNIFCEFPIWNQRSQLKQRCGTECPYIAQNVPGSSYPSKKTRT